MTKNLGQETEDQEVETSTTNDVAGRSSQVQHDHNNLKTSDGDLQHDGCDSADDADGAVGESESGAKQYVSESLLKDYSKFSVSVFSPMKTLDDSLLKKVKTSSS